VLLSSLVDVFFARLVLYIVVYVVLCIMKEIIALAAEVVLTIILDLYAIVLRFVFAWLGLILLDMITFIIINMRSINMDGLQ
jgi:hypothetical protein